MLGTVDLAAVDEHGPKVRDIFLSEPSAKDVADLLRVSDEHISWHNWNIAASAVLDRQVVFWCRPYDEAKALRANLPIRDSEPDETIIADYQGCDGQIADRLLDHLGPRTIVLADKAYDADRIRELIQEQGATPNIPPKSSRRWKPCVSKRLYRERNLIERFFSKLEHFRRVATRYDKLAANFLVMIQRASMRLWLRAYQSTA